VYLTGTVNSGPTPGFTAMTIGGTNDANSPVPLAGLSAFDIVVAKYTENGTSGTLSWVQALGNITSDNGTGIAVKGTSVCVTGNSGGKWYLPKLTDTGTAATQSWTYTGGGNGCNACTGLAANGANSYLTGSVTNNAVTANAVTFGSAGAPAGVAVSGVRSNASPDLVLLKYLDQGTIATLQWAQVAGGTQRDSGQGVAVSGTSVYVVGSAAPPTTFGNITFGNNANAAINFLAGLTDASTPEPLPVALTQFAATVEGSAAAVRLAWATASEKNSLRFEVERSADGVAFAAIGTVAAAGTTATACTYALRDVALPAGAALLHYRLRQVDLDGTAHYSPVRSVAVAAGLSLYPNPTAGGAATLAGAAPGALVQVLDALGRVAATVPADATGTARVPAGLVSGVYVVRAGSAALRLVVE